MENIFGNANKPGAGGWLCVTAAAIGLVDSCYLTWIKITDSVMSCSGIGACEAVHSSRYSEIAGIPIAIFGAGAFLALLALLYLEMRYRGQAQNLHLGVFGISLAGTLYSAYLTYIEIFVLQAICPFCVLSAAMITGLLVISISRIKPNFDYS